MPFPHTLDTYPPWVVGCGGRAGACQEHDDKGGERDGAASSEQDSSGEQDS